MLEYTVWAKRPDVVERPGRRPVSLRPFARLGGWRVALVKAGVLSAESLPHPIDRRPPPRRYAYTSEEVLDGLLRVAHRLKRSPSQAEYRFERERIAGETADARDPLVLPTPNVVHRHFDSWDSALAEAGLAPLQGSKHPSAGKKRPDYSREEKLRWLRRAWSEVGPPLTTIAYERWRRVLVAAGTSVPSVSTFKTEFGTWRAAITAAIPPDPDLDGTGREK
ncbi:MAG: homing endonuclease associated repeat-containing protein [Gaiellaceae bacterium]